MRRGLLLFALFCLAVAPRAKPLVKAKAYVLMEKDTGTILLEQRSHEKRDMASLTKIMTAVLALEHGRLNQKVTISRNAVNRKSDESTAWLEEGEVLTLEDLLYALLLRSANDATVAIAEAIAGSEQAFVEMMNRKARSLGLENTHFANPHGYYGKNHHSTALDLAELSRYALNYFPEFDRIIRTREKRIPWQGNRYDRVMRNHNKLLKKYPFADGIKTGYTRRAGKCLAASATKNGMRLIAVVLDSTDMYQDAINLFEYGFSQFTRKVIIPKNAIIAEDTLWLGKPRMLRYQTTMPVTYVGRQEEPYDFSVTVQKKNIQLPIQKGQPIGTLQVFWNGRLQKQIPLVSASHHDRSFSPLILPAMALLLPAPLLITLSKKKNLKKVKIKTVSQ